MGGDCHQKNKERGAWFEIKCLKENIISKEAKGETDTFGRVLLKSWSHYPGYESAKEALAECDRAVAGRRGKSKISGF
uniref:Uncharacterized protein n=1 Tax=viral metagenome TaxID=1070528 RepID=A0A6M3IFE6_9ZZZZ